ncbi:MAG: hypothetical protein K0R68_1390 [Mycobacterium sp.]|jgi:hypothetical protein|nr:hypothetical protein [Mycobacterium sp.]
MTTALSYLLLTAVLLAPFALIGTIAARAHRDGHLRWNLDQFRFSAPMIGRLFEDDRSLDADMRRLSHDLDAVRTRFEEQPSWPQSGALGERR